jgi:hypothetical protein
MRSAARMLTPRWTWFAFLSLGCASNVADQEPQGLARAALDNPSFVWIDRNTSHLRLHFLADSYPAAHQDSLIQRAESARRDILEMLGVDHFDDVVDIFFIESRAHMDSLVGFPVTGFADRDGRAVFLVTNPGWRAFERHEMMHVYAHHVWGPASGAWVEEGLAQFADGRCGAYTVDDVFHALAAPTSYVPMDSLIVHFRQMDDLTAYLQAASFVGFLYQEHGRAAARSVWERGIDALPSATGQTLPAVTESWWRWVSARARTIPADELGIIRDKGCG